MPVGFRNLSAESRRRKVARFLARLQPLEKDRLLEVGASGTAVETQVLGRYPWPERVVATNVEIGALETLKAAVPGVQCVLCDATAMPFRDGAFDIVYSNAVIEHMLTRAKQAAMAAEIRRCGKRWFVTTPNRWFPFEFHVRLPFLSWLAGTRAFRWLTALVCWDHDRDEYRFLRGGWSGPLLLGARGLRRLFPEGRVEKCRVTLWPETLAVWGETGRDAAEGRK